MSQLPSESSAPVAPRPLRIWPALVLLVVLAAAKASTYLAEEFSFGLFTFAVYAPLIVGVGSCFGGALLAAREDLSDGSARSR